MNNYLISADQLNQLIKQQKSIVLIDCRFDLQDKTLGQKMYLEGHLPGALYFDLNENLCGQMTGANGRHPLPSKKEFIAFLAQQGIQPSDHIIVYDEQKSMFASRLWWMLGWVGCHKVQILDGGFKTWEKNGGEVNTKSAKRSPKMIWTAPNSDYLVVDADDVLKNTITQEKQVIDARAAERYRGEIEPLDAKAGHIPYAINRCYELNLNSEGHFKEVESLKAQFNRLLQDVKPQDVIHQCGSGVSACHNIFVMEMIGLKGSLLYPGSWSEWCSDKSRPIETSKNN